MIPNLPEALTSIASALWTLVHLGVLGVVLLVLILLVLAWRR